MIDKKKYMFGALLIIITFAMYYPALFQGAIYDDYFLYNRSATTPVTSFEYYYPGMYLFRPNFVTQYSFSLDYKLWKNNFKGWHLTNIILHISIVCLLYIFIYSLTSNMLLAFFTALIFSIHPTRGEVVVWISGRQDLVCTFFFLISLIMAEKKKFIISLIAFALACFSKEMGIIFPLIYLIIIYIWRRNIEEYEKFGVGLAIILTFYLFVKFVIFGMNESFSSIFSIYDIIRTYLLYIGIFFYPYITSFPQSLANLTLIPFILSISYLSAIYFFRKDKNVLFGFLFFTVSILPVINILPIPDLIPHADRFIYIPSIGLAFSFAAMLNKLKKYQLIPFLLIFLILVPTTFKKIKMFGNYDSLVNEALKINPKNEAAYFLYGERVSNKKPKLAAKRFEKAIKLATYKNPYFYSSLIKAKFDLGDYVDGSKLLTKAVNIFDNSAPFYNLAGYLLIKMNKSKEAIKQFALAKKANEYDVTSYYNISQVLESMDKLKEGKEILKKAKKIAPWNYFIFNNYAMFCYQLKEYNESFKNLIRAKQLIENDIEVVDSKSDKIFLYLVILNNCALMEKHKGNIEKAKKIIKKIRELHKKYASDLDFNEKPVNEIEPLYYKNQ